jgi:hypothetical protein
MNEGKNMNMPPQGDQGAENNQITDLTPLAGMEIKGYLELSHKLASKYFHRAEGLPAEPAMIAALEKWANAWGEFTWQKKIENNPESEQESQKLKDMGTALDTAGKALEGVLPNARFLDGVVLWDGGHVELST